MFNEKGVAVAESSTAGKIYSNTRCTKFNQREVEHNCSYMNGFTSLRIALERSATAVEAIKTLTSLYDL